MNSSQPIIGQRVFHDGYLAEIRSSYHDGNRFCVVGCYLVERKHLGAAEDAGYFCAPYSDCETGDLAA